MNFLQIIVESCIALFTAIFIIWIILTEKKFRGKSDESGKLSEKYPGTRNINYLAIASMLLGTIAIIIYVRSKSDLIYPTWLGASLMISFACFGIGCIIGLLFGIPKSLLNNYDKSHEPNTNFEQISDWLTKILIGASLTQLGQIPSYMANISHKIVSGITCSSECSWADSSFVIFLIIFYLIIGFILTFFYAKIDYPKYLQKKLTEKDYQLNETKNELIEIIQNDLNKNINLSMVSNPTLNDDEKNHLRKLLTTFQKNILKQMIEDENKIYRLPTTRLMKFREFGELDHLIKLHIIKLLDGDSIYNATTIELTDKYKDITIGDIMNN